MKIRQIRGLHLLSPGLLAASLRLYRRAERAELGLISAGVAFFGFLALFPAAATVIALWGTVNDPSVIQTQVDLLNGVLPPEALNLLKAQVQALLEMRGPKLGWATVLSTLFALWSARAGVAALIRGLNAIHQLPNRSGGHHQLRALLLTLALIGLALAAMLVTVVAPLIISALPVPGDDASILHLANLALGVVLVVVAVGLAYRFGPNHGRRRPPILSWGLVVAVLLWAIAARGFMLYLANFPSYNRVYGSIGAVVVLLIWLYVSAYTVLLGAAVDAERNRRRQ
ncbi:YihY family inner membrane protein [bacterium]|nr:YihY family inner membrane protein [bacterium]